MYASVYVSTFIDMNECRTIDCQKRKQQTGNEARTIRIPIVLDRQASEAESVQLFQSLQGVLKLSVMETS